MGCNPQVVEPSFALTESVQPGEVEHSFLRHFTDLITSPLPTFHIFTHIGAANVGTLEIVSTNFFFSSDPKVVARVAIEIRVTGGAHGDSWDLIMTNANGCSVDIASIIVRN